jgi:putative DNA primase/helicase
MAAACRAADGEAVTVVTDKEILERIARRVLDAPAVERPVIAEREAAQKKTVVRPKPAKALDPPPEPPPPDPPLSAIAVEIPQPSQMGDFIAEYDGPQEPAGPQLAKDGRKGAGRGATERRNAGGPVKSAEDQAALDKRLAFFPMTDLGNAERFRERNRGRLVWCAAVGWFWWDGRRWAREGADGKVQMAAHLAVRSIQDEADAIAGTPADKVMGQKGPKDDRSDILYSMLLRAFGRESESNGKLNRLAEQASSYLEVQTSAFDADPFCINVGNGTLFIRKPGNVTGAWPANVAHDATPNGYTYFRPHDSADMNTKLAPVDYDPTAVRPLFDKFLEDVQPSAQMRRQLQAWRGLSLTGDVSEQKLCVFYGKGKNGKSVFEEICAHVAGDYCGTTPIETFLTEGRGRNAGQATPDLAVLPGVRMLRTSEPNKGARLNEGLIKLATGGEAIKARHLNRDYFDFYPSFKLTISGNHRPSISGTDEGIWRRVKLVPWTVRIPDEKQDAHLAVKLRAEASGILNWMLDGIADWLDHGLYIADETAEATAEYRRDSDQLGRFLEACTVVEAGARTQSSVLHDVFNKWSRANALNEWKGRGFSDAMTERGYRKDKSSVVYFLDLKLIKTAADFVDASGRPRDEQANDAGWTTPPDIDPEDFTM